MTQTPKEKILHLTLKKKWFDMIASGEKKEEYREIKEYWINRMYYHEKYHVVQFRNGYAKNAPTMIVECKGITKGLAKPEWSDNWQGQVFVIKLGNVLEVKNELNKM